MSPKYPVLGRAALIWLLLSSALPLHSAIPDPAEFRQGVMKNPQLAKTDGELFCWNAQIGAGDLLRGYEATGDPAWLREAVTYFGFLTSKLTKDPDGYEGWIGETIWGATDRMDHSKYRMDALVGDAIILQHLVRFAELVKNDPALQQEFGADAGKYVDLATRVGWEKWNKRGCYYRDAAGWGSYWIPVKFIDAETGKWVDAPLQPHSENLNKHSAMGIVLLRLYRITGNEEYRDRVVEIFSRLRHIMRYYPEEDRVVWNFWMPHGPHDIKKDDPKKLSSWVAVHPKSAGYQAEEVSRMVEVYDSGLVFDEADLKRLINTNHFMRKADGSWQAADGASKAGTLWGSLARFDSRIREELKAKLARPKNGAAEIDKAYFENITQKNVGFKRMRLAEGQPLKLETRAPMPGQFLSATVVIPNRIGTREAPEATLVAQTRAVGDLVIELLDRDGKKVLGQLYKGKGHTDGRILMPRWDGKNPATGAKTPGEYIVRFTLNEETRLEPVWVQ